MTQRSSVRVATEWRLGSLEQKGIALYAASDETLRMMTEASLTAAGTVLQSSRKLEEPATIASGSEYSQVLATLYAPANS